MISGREAIKGFWTAAVDALAVESATLETVEAEMLGDRIFEIGRAVLNVTGGATATVKYVVQWVQEDGAWKWNVDIWNPNA